MGGDSLRIRVSDMAAIFEVYLLVVALGALKTAVDSQGPWFNEVATLWAYATTFIGSMILVSVLVLAGVFLTRSAGAGDARHSRMVSNRGQLQQTALLEPDDADVEELLASIDQATKAGKTSATTVTATRGLMEVTAAPGRDDAVTVQRSRARRVLLALLGPSATAALFGGLCAALLPGSGGFLQSNYTLNTFFILTFAYGWGGLLAYTVASLFLAAADT